MKLAALASLIADPARARMLTALIGGTALTATELANVAGVTPSTTSSHLAKLTEAKLLATERQGRHRYFRVFDEEVAAMLENLMGMAARDVVRTGPRDPALRAARVCYDHLAGERGVWLFDHLRRGHAIDAASVTASGRAMFARLGIDVAALDARPRPVVRTCLDWSERRHHLAGSLGAAILQRVFALRWARRELDSRAIVFSASGARAFREAFGVQD